MTGKLRAVVIFPGRGSYGSSELGYLARYHGAQNDWIERFDEQRFAAGAERTLELDGTARFSPSRHLPGRNASNLIYTCAMADFAAIDRQTYEIAAICGNSLGAASNAVSLVVGGVAGRAATGAVASRFASQRRFGDLSAPQQRQAASAGDAAGAAAGRIASPKFCS